MVKFMTNINRKEDMKKAIENEAKQEVMVMDATERNLMQQEDMGSFYSLQATTRKEKVALYNAISNPQERLGDHINEKIMVKDLLIEIIELVNDSTGELQRVPRMVILDDKGVSYVAVSIGIFSALKRIIKLFGEPTWEEPVELKVKQITKGEKKLLTFELI